MFYKKERRNTLATHIFIYREMYLDRERALQLLGYVVKFSDIGCVEGFF
jgi:hypothetical protein